MIRNCILDISNINNGWAMPMPKPMVPTTNGTRGGTNGLMKIEWPKKNRRI
jgi:hypothetical protein